MDIRKELTSLNMKNSLCLTMDTILYFSDILYLFCRHIEVWPTVLDCQLIGLFLARFIYLREDYKLVPSREIFKTSVSEVQTIWGQAFVPTKPDPNVLFLVSSLYQKWNS